VRLAARGAFGMCFWNRQRLAGTRRVHQREHVRPCAGTADTRLREDCRTNVLPNDRACTRLPPMVRRGSTVRVGGTKRVQVRGLAGTRGQARRLGWLCDTLRRGAVNAPPGVSRHTPRAWNRISAAPRHLHGGWRPPFEGQRDAWGSLEGTPDRLWVCRPRREPVVVDGLPRGYRSGIRLSWGRCSCSGWARRFAC
jgi:hypothetical protein